MSELRSVLDQMAAVADEDMTVAELHADIEEALNGRRMLDVLIATRVRRLANENAEDEVRTS